MCSGRERRRALACLRLCAGRCGRIDAVQHHDGIEAVVFPRSTIGARPPFANANNVTRTIEVEAHRLDAVYADLQTRFGFMRPFLKLDTQGYDLKVAAGAGATLLAFHGVVTEMGVRILYESSPNMTDSLSAFRDWGFDPVGFYSVHPGVILDPHEFNCYLLRRDLARVN